MEEERGVCEEYYLENSYNNFLIKSLNEQRQDGMLCDVTLVAEEHKFPVHRSILAAASQYFARMFQDHFSESRKLEIPIQSLSKQDLQMLLDLIYTGKIKLNIDNMHSILAASDHLLLDNAKRFCVMFMKKVLTSRAAAEEALRIKSNAEMYSLLEVQQLADSVIRQQFSLISKSQTFLELTTKEVKDVLKMALDFETDEFTVWKASVNWIAHDEEKRFEHIESLMSEIRFALIEPSVLVSTIHKHELMVKSESCQQFIQQAIEYQLQPILQSRMQSSQTSPRCKLQDKILYCLSGLQHFKCYILQQNRWYSLSAPPVDENIKALQEQGKRLKLQLMNVNGLVFLSVKSSVPEEVVCCELKALLRYNIESNQWVRCQLPQGCNHKPIVLIECNFVLYACSRQSIQLYDIENDQWHKCYDVNLDPSQLIVSDENHIYFFNLEEGIAQILRVAPDYELNKQMIMTQNRFIMGVPSCTKLPNHEVYISLRTVTGTTRKIFNVKSNQWRDCSMSHGFGRLQPRSGIHFPSSLTLSDHWESVCDRSNNCLYILATNSGLSDIPPYKALMTVTFPQTAKNSNLENQPTMLDGVLPFFKLDMNDSTWKRLACLPEFMGCGDIVLCMCDGQSTMAVACSF